MTRTQSPALGDLGFNYREHRRRCVNRFDGCAGSDQAFGQQPRAGAEVDDPRIVEWNVGVMQEPLE